MTTQVIQLSITPQSISGATYITTQNRKFHVAFGTAAPSDAAAWHAESSIYSDGTLGTMWIKSIDNSYGTSVVASTVG